MKRSRLMLSITAVAAVLALSSFIAGSQRLVTGKIVGLADKGISNAYIYVVAGEEETLSIADGRFSLKTWQPLPVTLVVEHADFEKQKIVVKIPGQELVIRLAEKRPN